jgi:hypothetical protein
VCTYGTVLFAPTQVEIKKESTKRNKHAMLIIAVKTLRFVHLHENFLKYIALISMTSIVLKQEIKKYKTSIVL